VTYIDSRGRRVTTQSAYLTPAVLKRPNLKIAVNASVAKILFKQRDGKTRAVGAEFASTENGPRYRVYARKEVVLACVWKFVQYSLAHNYIAPGPSTPPR
jgi:choline dehydrogenase